MAGEHDPARVDQALDPAYGLLFWGERDQADTVLTGLQMIEVVGFDRSDRGCIVNAGAFWAEEWHLEMDAENAGQLERVGLAYHIERLAIAISAGRDEGWQEMCCTALARR